jgi:hypothetical protein
MRLGTIRGPTAAAAALPPPQYRIHVGCGTYIIGQPGIDFNKYDNFYVTFTQ